MLISITTLHGRILPNAFAVPDDEVIPQLQLPVFTTTTQQVSVSVSERGKDFTEGRPNERPDWRANGQIAAADDGDALAPLRRRPSSHTLPCSPDRPPAAPAFS